MKSVLGFIPDPVCTYDAVSYTEGVKQNEQVLIEASGIPALKTIIQERLQAISQQRNVIYENRLEKKSEKLHDEISELVAPLQQTITKLSDRIQSASIDPEKLQNVIERCQNLCKEAIADISVPEPLHYSSVINLPISDGYYSGLSSEYSAKSKAKEALRKPYDHRESVINDLARKAAEEIYAYTIFDHRKGNYYYDKNTAVTRVIHQCNDLFRQIGVQLPTSAIAEIAVQPKPCSVSENALYSAIKEDVVEYGGYYSLDKYVDMYADIDDQELYLGEGLFGSKYKTTYSCSLWNAKREMEKDLGSNLDRNVKSEFNKVKGTLEGFCSELKSEIKKRLDSMTTAARSIAETSDKKSKQELEKLQEIITSIQEYVIL